MGQPIPRAGAALNGAGTLAYMEVQSSGFKVQREAVSFTLNIEL
jgi:hypothetical protein